ncbi:hypothetical protein [uncultured Paraglaciecola sp.]|uniref:hypothetical protein n=1 Tax=uncultured Paraglaciecola sp. TaxID=1765024 RepID=UPI0026399E5C|nr:hypothetical protein [uncultured Paraglaciecola sp.]
MSFREKSIWISLLSSVVIFGNYFFNIITLPSLPVEVAKLTVLGFSIRAIIFIIIVETFFQVTLAICNRKEAELDADERDKLFQYKSNSVSYSILIIGVFMTLGLIVLMEINPAIVDQFSALKVPLLTMQVLLFSFIFSEVIRFSTQLYFYRSSE